MAQAAGSVCERLPALSGCVPEFFAPQPVIKANKLSTCERKAGGDSFPLGLGRCLGSGKVGLFGLWILSGSFCCGGFP